MNWIEEEDKKYSELYKNGYPMGNPFGLIKEFGYTEDMKACDLGCGRANLARYFKDYTGGDVSSHIISVDKIKYPDGKFYNLSMSDLSQIKDESFDIVICSDVMEHIPEDHVDEVLKEISTLKSSKFAMSISTRPSVFLSTTGENLHLTVWSSEKWLDDIRKYFTVINHSIKGSLLSVECQKLENE